MTHHACCFVGIEFGRQALDGYLTTNAVDTVVTDCSDFGISEARHLSQQAYMSPTVGSEQTFIIITETITHEAQNALLKLFEEPPQRSVFKLVVPKRGGLLPTLQSRLHFIEGTNDQNELPTADDSFFDLSYGDRITKIAAMVKEKKQAEIESLVATAETIASRSQNRDALAAVSFVRSQIGRRGASKKMLLELLALSVPQKG